MKTSDQLQTERAVIMSALQLPEVAYNAPEHDYWTSRLREVDAQIHNLHKVG